MTNTQSVWPKVYSVSELQAQRTTQRRALQRRLAEIEHQQQASAPACRAAGGDSRYSSWETGTRMENMMRNGLLGMLLAFFLAAPTAHAAEIVPPDVLAKSVTEDVLATLRASREIRAGDFAKTVDLIETKILPHFDFATMTRLAMGKNWAQASPEQRMALTGGFRTLLARTYTASLRLYRDQTIAYRPLNITPGDTDVLVKSVVRQAGREPIAVDYRMQRTESGWKVYDVEIAGISLVQNYRGVFNAEIHRSDIDGLIKALARKNSALAGNGDIQS